MKKKRIVLVVVLSVFAAVTIAATASIGGYMWYQQRQQDEMAKVVYSDEAKLIYEDYLKYIESDALTQKGKIQTYTITEFEHNPMGGIIVYMIINDNSEYDVTVFLGKDSNNKLVGTGGSYPKSLKEFANGG